MKKFLALVCAIAVVFTFILAYTLEENRILDEIDQSCSAYYALGTGDTCYLPDCDRAAIYHYFFVVDSTCKRHANLTISTKVPCKTEGVTRIREKFETYQSSDQYIKVVPDGWGNYYAYLKEETSSHKVSTGEYQVYCLDVSGSYCDEHNAKAVESIKNELKKAVCDNLPYFYGRTLYPYNAIVLIALFIYLFWKGFKNSAFVRSFKVEGEAIAAIRNEKELEKLHSTLSYSSGGSIGFAIFFLLPLIICLIKAKSENWKIIWIVSCCLSALIELKYIIEVILLKRKIRIIEEQIKLSNK